MQHNKNHEEHQFANAAHLRCVRAARAKTVVQRSVVRARLRRLAVRSDIRIVCTEDTPGRITGRGSHLRRLGQQSLKPLLAN